MIARLYDTYLRSRRVVTDTREVTPGSLFFAFKGERFDGNAFAPQALEQGAALCVVSAQWKSENGSLAADERIIGVPDVLATLQDLAREHRSHLTIPVIGITGTNGKTTTKELVTAVLSRRYTVSATRGNFNNHLGVPLTLLSIPEEAQIAVVEMGANHPGEIAFLCGISDPDCGLITNVGRAHLEGFGGFEGVVSTKTELYRWLAGKGGLVFVNADNERLMHESERLATIPGLRSFIPAYAPDTPAFVPSTIAKTPLSMLTYGGSSEADIRGSHVADTPFMKFYFEVGDDVYAVQTHLLGGYNFDNCMAAVAVGLHFGVPPFDIKEAIEAYTPTNRRSQFKVTERGNKLYLDCYNANPSSMRAAIDGFIGLTDTVPHRSTYAVIGGMKELGRESRAEHERLLSLLQDVPLNQLLLVGSEFGGLALPSRAVCLPDVESVCRYLSEASLHDALVFVKGSNGNRLWMVESVL